jgi:mannose/fructose/N-acetylgalactosamine-specific phosphotransferase system component IID
VNNLIGQIIFRIDADTLPVLKGVTLLSLAGNAIGIILAFVTVKVIRDYAEAEEVLFRMKEETVIVEDEKLIENASL